MLGHAVLRQEEVAGGSGEVQQATRAQAVHETGDGAQLVQIVPDGYEGQGQQQVVAPGGVILAQDGEHGLGVLGLR